MEETTGCLIQRGCELSRHLELDLPNLANQPDILFTSIDEIVNTFLAAKESLRLFSQHQTPPSSSFDHMPATSNFMPEWPIRFISHAQPTDQSIHDQMQRPQAAQKRLRKSNSRKSDLETKTVMVEAPKFGNTEIPPEDGFTWRKYGQKEIFGCVYPRSYYRCTHQKLYKCPAKKQVQRVDNSPHTFAVTYRGSHTCVMSSTAPSSAPPPHLFVDFNTTVSPQLSSSSTSVSQWLPSPHLGLCTGGASAATPGTAGGGPSTSRYGSSTDYTVADMANAMFNNSTGSSAANARYH
ncbi:hypothetical protein QN277_017115 [Acacia crassicarpa]|uniref:WRKY domain-containing protein n=1 Tax=Acacia crassicarpa TaxID=499986 RepID=A0AAE1KFL6_9FABA|nr:hypothetical protein QN277_017115 [Acacia crassicarpa]